MLLRRSVHTHDCLNVFLIIFVRRKGLQDWLVRRQKEGTLGDPPDDWSEKIIFRDVRVGCWTYWLFIDIFFYT